MSELARVSAAPTPGEGYDIREASAVDILGMGYLWTQSVKESGLADPDTNAWMQQVSDLMRVGRHVGVVIHGPEGLIGFTSAVLVYEPGTRRVEVHGKEVYVRPSDRGCGLCEAMYGTMVKVARSREAVAFVTQDDLKGNSPSKSIAPHMAGGIEMRHYLTWNTWDIPPED